MFESWSSHIVCLTRQECAPNDPNSITVLCALERSGIANSAQSFEAVILTGFWQAQLRRDVLTHLTFIVLEGYQCVSAMRCPVWLKELALLGDVVLSFARHKLLVHWNSNVVACIVWNGGTACQSNLWRILFPLEMYPKAYCAFVKLCSIEKFHSAARTLTRQRLF